MQNKLNGYAVENIVAQHLTQQGWRVVEQNFKQKFGEIDIIAHDKQGVLVAVEVKSASKNADFLPEEHFTQHKLRKIEKTFQHYITLNNLHNKECRIDLVSVEIDLATNTPHAIRHYKNATL